MNIAASLFFNLLCRVIFISMNNLEKNLLFCRCDNLVQVVTQFLKLETRLDDTIDGELDLLIERGGVPLTVKLKVCLKFLM